jgi:hypothetical protein
MLLYSAVEDSVAQNHHLRRRPVGLRLRRLMEELDGFLGLSIAMAMAAPAAMATTWPRLLELSEPVQDLMPP